MGTWSHVNLLKTAVKQCGALLLSVWRHSV